MQSAIAMTHSVSIPLSSWLPRWRRVGVALRLPIATPSGWCIVLWIWSLQMTTQECLDLEWTTPWGYDKLIHCACAELLGVYFSDDHLPNRVHGDIAAHTFRLGNFIVSTSHENLFCLCIWQGLSAMKTTKQTIASTKHSMLWGGGGGECFCVQKN